MTLGSEYFFCERVADTGDNSPPSTARVTQHGESVAMYPTAVVLISPKNERTMDAQAAATRQRMKLKDNARHPARQPIRRPSASKSDHDIRFEDADVEIASVWHDAPLFAAILPCVGALFLWDGADYVTDTILFICVTWYLHMLIKGTYLILGLPFSLLILRSILMSSQSPGICTRSHDQGRVRTSWVC